MRCRVPRKRSALGRSKGVGIPRSRCFYKHRPSLARRGRFPQTVIRNKEIWTLSAPPYSLRKERKKMVWKTRHLKVSSSAPRSHSLPDTLEPTSQLTISLRVPGQSLKPGRSRESREWFLETVLEINQHPSSTAALKSKAVHSIPYTWVFF